LNLVFTVGALFAEKKRKKESRKERKKAGRKERNKERKKESRKERKKKGTHKEGFFNILWAAD
jgi:hypothetical protein